MAIPPAPPSALSPAQLASIPSASLPLGPQLALLLQEFQRLSLQLFALLSQSSPSASSPAASIYAQLAALDRQLAGLMPLLEAHQNRQARIEELISELKTTEDAWQNGARALHDAKKALTPVIQSGAVDRKAIERSAPPEDATSMLTPSTILSYARLLAPFTSAPPSSVLLSEQQLIGDGAGAHLDPTGTRLPPGAWPPFPTEGAMRRGRLQFGKEDVGMGETGEVGGECSINPHGLA